MVWLTEAKYLEAYRVWLRFNDGLEGTIDLQNTIFDDPREIVRATQDPELFRQVRLEMDTLVWPNGLDLAPEYLHALLKNSLVGR